MKRLIACILMILFLVSCGGATWPVCNEKFSPEAKIVQIANVYETCLDDVGKLLILANGANISLLGMYTAEQALSVVENTQIVLKEPITEVLFKTYVLEHMGAFPELFMITDTFLISFNEDSYIDQGSKDIIDGLLEKIKPLLVARINSLK